MKRFIAGVFALGLLGGCVEKADPVTAVDKQAVSRWVGQTPTEPQHPMQTKLGEKVELIGYDLQPAVPVPGRAFTITWHWKVLEPLGDGWMLFTHVSDAGGGSVLNQDMQGLIRRAYPPGQWKKGDYIRDAQRITLPDSWSGDEASIYIGIWKGKERLPPSGGPHDGTGRALGAKLKLGKRKAEPEAPLPELVAKRLSAPPSLDGKLDDAAWKQAARTDALVNTMTGGKAEPESHVRAAYDDDNLYFAFDVEDTFLRSDGEKYDDHLWEQDCVEVMVDPDGDGKNYFELQVSPKGVVFDTRYDTRRRPQPFGHVDWNTNLKNGVSVRGEVNDDDEDEGYSVEMAIPFEAFAAGATPAAKPKPGEEWRVNFYVLDAREKGQRGVGWSAPKVGDFHVPQRFGKLRFE